MHYKHNTKIKVHPGQILQNILEEMKITQSALATNIGVTQSYISDIVSGRRNMTAVMAHKLSVAVGLTPETWMNLQQNWELSKIDPKITKDIKKMAA